MIPATSASLPINDPRHPLCHDDCAYCREHYDDYFAPPAAPPGRAKYEAEAISRAFKDRDLRLLRAYRDLRGLTQKQLASLSGVCQQQISELERGTIKTRVVTATKLAEALGVEVEDLEGTS